MIFNCPSCSTPIGDVVGSGVADFVCGHCRFRYRVTTGELIGCTSKSVIVRSELLKRPVEELQVYELQLDLGEGVRRLLSFEMEGHRALALTSGDRLSVVHWLRRSDPEDVLSVINHTSGVNYQIAVPGERSRTLELWMTVGLTAAALFGFGAIDLALGAGGAVLTFLVATVGLKRVLSPRPELGEQERRKVMQLQSVLTRKQELELQLERVQQERLRKVGLRGRLHQLIAKMESVDAALYAARIEQLGVAVATVDEQIRLDDCLLDGYRRSVAILEIEVEASAHFDQLPDNVEELLRARARELSSIQEQNQELELQLAANQEVERLLKGS